MLPWKYILDGSFAPVYCQKDVAEMAGLMLPATSVQTFKIRNGSQRVNTMEYDWYCLCFKKPFMVYELFQLNLLIRRFSIKWRYIFLISVLFDS